MKLKGRIYMGRHHENKDSKNHESFSAEQRSGGPQSLNEDITSLTPKSVEDIPADLAQLGAADVNAALTLLHMQRK